MGGYHAHGDIHHPVSCTLCPIHCDQHANCLDDGSGNYHCECLDGFSGDGSQGNCHDVDECAEGTDNCAHAAHGATCHNVLGGFECVCNHFHCQTRSTPYSHHSS